MLTNEFRVSKDSDSYVYVPSVAAYQMLFYPTIVGRFRYLPGYHLKRKAFGNYLIILVEEGSIQVHIHGTEYTAPAHSLVFLDCYSTQEYGSLHGATVLWMHFEGATSRQFYEHVSQNLGNVFTPPDYHGIQEDLNAIYEDFHDSLPIDEVTNSRRIYDILLQMLPRHNVQNEAGSGIKRSIIYIKEHFAEDIPLQTLSDVACLSPYYFTRCFRKETGLTPHQYILETRIRSAQFLLSSTDRSVKEIALDVGFSDESGFCASFRRHTGETPSKYRARIRCDA